MFIAGHWSNNAFSRSLFCYVLFWKLVHGSSLSGIMDHKVIVNDWMLAVDMLTVLLLLVVMLLVVTSIKSNCGFRARKYDSSSIRCIWLHHKMLKLLLPSTIWDGSLYEGFFCPYIWSKLSFKRNINLRQTITMLALYLSCFMHNCSIIYLITYFASMFSCR